MQQLTASCVNFLLQVGGALSRFLACLSQVCKFVRAENFFGVPLSESVPSILKSRALEIELWCEDHLVEILFPGHQLYPDCFLELESPPLFLSVLGKIQWSARRHLAVVGSREASCLALEWMDQHLGRVISDSQAVTVSGGARGIDQKAHAMSLRRGLPTIAFLPSGLGCVYPANFQSWIPEILKSGGAVISEFAPLTPMRKFHFERRNRLIAGLGDIVFVVEAARRSGSIMTARLARDGGKTVCTLPSFPGDPGSAGSLDLIFDGAFPIRDGDDLAALLALFQRPQSN